MGRTSSRKPSWTAHPAARSQSLHAVSDGQPRAAGPDGSLWPSVVSILSGVVLTLRPHWAQLKADCVSRCQGQQVCLSFWGGARLMVKLKQDSGLEAQWCLAETGVRVGAAHGVGVTPPPRLAGLQAGAWVGPRSPADRTSPALGATCLQPCPHQAVSEEREGGLTYNRNWGPEAPASFLLPPPPGEAPQQGWKEVERERSGDKGLPWGRLTGPAAEGIPEGILGVV